MSRLGLGTQMLSRCGSSWMRAGSIVPPMGTWITTSGRTSIRQVSTTRPKKAQAKKEAEKGITGASSKEKAPKAAVNASAKTKQTSTKAAIAPKQGVTAPAKQTRTTKSKTAAGNTAETKTTAPATKTPKTAAAASNVEISEPMVSSESPVKQKATANPPTRFSASHHPAANLTKPTAPLIEQAPPPTPEPVSRGPPSYRREEYVPKVDTSSPEYKEAARKWTATMIALPILFVTSYFLFDRCESSLHSCCLLSVP